MLDASISIPTWIVFVALVGIFAGLGWCAWDCARDVQYERDRHGKEGGS